MAPKLVRTTRCTELDERKTAPNYDPRFDTPDERFCWSYEIDSPPPHMPGAKLHVRREGDGIALCDQRGVGAMLPSVHVRLDKVDEVIEALRAARDRIIRDAAPNRWSRQKMTTFSTDLADYPGEEPVSY